MKFNLTEANELYIDPAHFDRADYKTEVRDLKKQFATTQSELTRLAMSISATKPSTEIIKMRSAIEKMEKEFLSQLK
jgi:hypothetical protein